jgi:hypothetical protein
MSSRSEGSRLDRIPLHRQPPIWLMVGVVVATLVPLTMHVFAASASDHVERDVALVLAPAPARELVASAAVERPLVTPSIPVVAKVASAEELIRVDVEVDIEESEPCPAPCDERPQPSMAEPREEPSIGRSAIPRANEASSRPPLLSKAAAACREGDKKSARSTYRAIPVGDSRRKEIRKACRREGVWIL